jgi:hypothetical protein
MPPKNSSRRPAKKPVGTEKGKSSVVASEIIASVNRQIDRRWPNLRRQLGGLLRVGREKLDDLYSSAAQTISEHTEAFQDRLAEKKALNRAATRGAKETKVPIRPTPRKKGKTATKGTTKGTSGRQRSKKPSRSAPKPHS